MPKCYQKAHKSVMQIVQKVMEEHHKELLDEKVQVAVLLVWGPRDKDGLITGPGVSAHGHAALAKIKVSSESDRLLSGADAVMHIDGDCWEKMKARTKRALLDHELTHLELLVTADGTTKRREDSSARLGAKLDDWMLTGFYAIAKRYEKDAPEVMGLANLHAQCQMVFDFAKKAASDAEAA